MRHRIARLEKQRERRLARQGQEKGTDTQNAIDVSCAMKESVEDPKANYCEVGSPPERRCTELEKNRKELYAIDEDDDLVEVARMLDRKKSGGRPLKRPRERISPLGRGSRQRVTRHDDSDSDDDLMAFFRKKQQTLTAKRKEHVAEKDAPSIRNDDCCSQGDAKKSSKKDHAESPTDPIISVPHNVTKGPHAPNIDRCQSEEVEHSAASTRTETTWENVKILGTEMRGKFHLEKDAMGVPGFHVAVNVFSEEMHRQLFEDSVFTANTIPFVQDQAVPLRQAIIHPTKPPPASMHPWPQNWHRLINAVRDSGLFPSATIPDCGYALSYGLQSAFPPHHDGRGKWGEYVIVASFGAPVTVTFQHGAPKRNPVDSTKPWNFRPPPAPPGSYYLRSQTERPDDMYKRKLWQVSMILPPNSVYVMSGPSRYDWRHGINWHGRDGVPPLLPSVVPESTYPIWNSSRVRRAVVFRSTKVFCDLSLEMEEERAREAGDSIAVAELVSRRKASARFKYDAEDCRRKLNEAEIAVYRSLASEVLNSLLRSGAHRLRFLPSQVHFNCSEQRRAVADPLPDKTSEAVDRGENNRTSAMDEEEMQIRRAIELSLAEGRREGTRKHAAAAAAKRPDSSPDVICLEDSDDEGNVSCLIDRKVTQNQHLLPTELVKWASKHCTVLGIDVSSNGGTRATSSALLPGSDFCYFDGTTLVDRHPKTSIGGGWIWVRNSSYIDRSVGDIESFESEWLVLAKEFSDNSPPSHRDVLSLAEKHGVLYGKWLLRVSLNFAPELWTKIRNGMLDGKLGPTAKISQSPEAGEKTLIVCVYVPDFRDKAEVLRIRRALHYDVKVYTKSCLYFKPDCFTHIDLFHRWKQLKKSIYRCGGETKAYKDLGCSTLFVNEAKCTRKKGCPRCYPTCLE